MKPVQEELFDWLCLAFGWASGTNAFINRLPDTNQTGQRQPVVWLIENTASVERQFASHTKLKNYSFVLNYRAPRARDVDYAIMEIEEVINHLHCFTLPSYTVMNIEAQNFNSDEDADAENFYRGLVYLRLTIMDNYEIKGSN